jgi:hypothetical protein
MCPTDREFRIQSNRAPPTQSRCKARVSALTRVVALTLRHEFIRKPISIFRCSTNGSPASRPASGDHRSPSESLVSRHMNNCTDAASSASMQSGGCCPQRSLGLKCRLRRLAMSHTSRPRKLWLYFFRLSPSVAGRRTSLSASCAWPAWKPSWRKGLIP